MKCPKCHKMNPSDANYCHMCGVKLYRFDDFDKWSKYWKEEFDNNYEYWLKIVKNGVDGQDIPSVHLFSVTFKYASSYKSAINDLDIYGYGKPDWCIETCDDNRWNVLLTCPNVPLVIRVANMHGGRITKWNTYCIAKPPINASINPIVVKYEIIQLIRAGKLSEALNLYQSKMGVNIKQAQQYIDKLRNENNIHPKSTTNSNSGCYIATAVYGSYDCPEVWTLRRYRDYVLNNSWYGRLFVRCYYNISPTLVKWFGETKWFKKVFKKQLNKRVYRLINRGFESTPYNDIN